MLLNNGKQIEGIKLGLKQFILTAPVIIGAFILLELLKSLYPKSLLKAGFLQRQLKGCGPRNIWRNDSCNWTICILPIVASILSAGAGLGTIISTITGWCLLGFSKMPYETAFVGR